MIGKKSLAFTNVLRDGISFRVDGDKLYPVYTVEIDRRTGRVFGVEHGCRVPEGGKKIDYSPYAPYPRISFFGTNNGFHPSRVLESGEILKKMRWLEFKVISLYLRFMLQEILGVRRTRKSAKRMLKRDRPHSSQASD